MSISKNILLGLLLTLMPAAVLGAFNLEQWPYYKDVTRSGGAGLTRVPLDDDILSRAKSDLSDIRLADERHAEVPYQLVVGVANVAQKTFNPAIVNTSFVSGESSSAVLDFTGGELGVNHLIIETPTRNFQRRVSVYGSDDATRWRTIKEDGYIYDFTDTVAGVRTQNTTVTFAVSVFKYLKVVIADPEGKPVKISGVKSARYTREPEREVTRQPRFDASLNREEKSSELVVDLATKGLGITKVSVNADDANFKRTVFVYAGDGSDKWRFVGSGHIFRYTTPAYAAEHRTVAIQKTDDLYLKINIVNNDDAPLVIRDVEVSSVYRELLFISQSDTRYALYYGNERADAPRYDLAAYVNYLDTTPAPVASLSEQKENTVYVPVLAPLTERVPYLLPITLSVLSVGLLFLVYLFFKRR